MIKLYFGINLKLANRGISRNIGKSEKSPAGILGFFYVTTYLHVCIKQLQLMSGLEMQKTKKVQNE